MIRSRPLLTASALALLSALSLTAAPAAAAPAARPDLPDEQTLETGHFLIHYTARGEDAVDGADADGSGVPDYVELVAATLENVWQVEIVEMGWAPPPPDGGRGGGEEDPAGGGSAPDGARSLASSGRAGAVVSVPPGSRVQRAARYG